MASKEENDRATRPRGGATPPALPDVTSKVENDRATGTGRYKWQCPSCRRKFSIPAGESPLLCPECLLAGRSLANSSEPEPNANAYGNGPSAVDHQLSTSHGFWLARQSSCFSLLLFFELLNS